MKWLWFVGLLLAGLCCVEAHASFQLISESRPNNGQQLDATSEFSSLVEVASAAKLKKLQLDTKFVFSAEVIATYVVQGMTVLLDAFTAWRVSKLLESLHAFQEEAASKFDENIAKQRKYIGALQTTLTDVNTLSSHMAVLLEANVPAGEVIEGKRYPNPILPYYQTLLKVLRSQQTTHSLQADADAHDADAADADGIEAFKNLVATVKLVSDIATATQVLAEGHKNASVVRDIPVTKVIKNSIIDQFDRAKIQRMVVAQVASTLAEWVLKEAAKAVLSYVGLGLAVYDLYQSAKVYKAQTEACTGARVDYDYLLDEMVQDFKYSTCRYVEQIKIDRRVFWLEYARYAKKLGATFTRPDDWIKFKKLAEKIRLAWEKFETDNQDECADFYQLPAPQIQISDRQLLIKSGFVRMWAVPWAKDLQYCWLYRGVRILTCVSAEDYEVHLTTLSDVKTKPVVIALTREQYRQRYEFFKRTDFRSLDLIQHPLTGDRDDALSTGHIVLKDRVVNFDFKPVVAYTTAIDRRTVLVARQEETRSWIEAIALAVTNPTLTSSEGVPMLTDMWATKRGRLLTSHGTANVMRNADLVAALGPNPRTLYPNEVSPTYWQTLVRTQYHDLAYPKSLMPARVAYNREHRPAKSALWLSETEGALLVGRTATVNREDVTSGILPALPITSIVQTIVSHVDHFEWNGAEARIDIPGPIPRRTYQFIGELPVEAVTNRRPVNFLPNSNRTYISMYLAMSFWPGAPIVAVSTECREGSPRTGWTRVPQYIFEVCHSQRLGETEKQPLRRLCYAKDRRLFTPTDPSGIPSAKLTYLSNRLDATDSLREDLITAITKARADEEQHKEEADKRRLEEQRRSQRSALRRQVEAAEVAQEDRLAAQRREAADRKAALKSARDTVRARIAKPKTLSFGMSIQAVTGAPDADEYALKILLSHADGATEDQKLLTKRKLATDKTFTLKFRTPIFPDKCDAEKMFTVKMTDKIQLDLEQERFLVWNKAIGSWGATIAKLAETFIADRLAKFDAWIEKQDATSWRHPSDHQFYSVSDKIITRKLTVSDDFPEYSPMLKLRLKLALPVESVPDEDDVDLIRCRNCAV